MAHFKVESLFLITLVIGLFCASMIQSAPYPTGGSSGGGKSGTSGKGDLQILLDHLLTNLGSLDLQALLKQLLKDLNPTVGDALNNLSEGDLAALQASLVSKMTL
ncbi:uncharacterized protein [Parasteatoda tepidariorum]|uniref:uncharacterized protein n=1 Tax=Parasteatoda tepidariorum TaxID=114398 RepID=UPI0039BD931E